MKGLNEPFIFEILAIVSVIPKGYVATYRQIAELADCRRGHPVYPAPLTRLTL